MFFIPFWLLPRSDVGNHALHEASAQTRMSALRFLALDAEVQQPCQSCDDKDFSDPYASTCATGERRPPVRCDRCPLSWNQLTDARSKQLRIKCGLAWCELSCSCAGKGARHPLRTRVSVHGYRPSWAPQVSIAWLSSSYKCIEASCASS